MIFTLYKEVLLKLNITTKHTILFFMFFFGIVNAQNNVPVITNISIDIISCDQCVRVRYELEDMDNDSIQIDLNIFCNDRIYTLSESDFRYI
jgi:hypothetical protein